MPGGQYLLRSHRANLAVETVGSDIGPKKRGRPLQQPLEPDELPMSSVCCLPLEKRVVEEVVKQRVEETGTMLPDDSCRVTRSRSAKLQEGKSVVSVLLREVVEEVVSFQNKAVKRKESMWQKQNFVLKKPAVRLRSKATRLQRAVIKLEKLTGHWDGVVEPAAAAPRPKRYDVFVTVDRKELTIVHRRTMASGHKQSTADVHLIKDLVAQGVPIRPGKPVTVYFKYIENADPKKSRLLIAKKKFATHEGTPVKTEAVEAEGVVKEVGDDGWWESLLELGLEQQCLAGPPAPLVKSEGQQDVKDAPPASQTVVNCYANMNLVDCLETPHEHDPIHACLDFFNQIY